MSKSWLDDHTPKAGSKLQPVVRQSNWGLLLIYICPMKVKYVALMFYLMFSVWAATDLQLPRENETLFTYVLVDVLCVVVFQLWCV